MQLAYIDHLNIFHSIQNKKQKQNKTVKRHEQIGKDTMKNL